MGATDRKSGDFYGEYYQTRVPSSFGRKILRFWHARMFRLAQCSLPEFKNLRLCEIGAGWGFFASVCREHKVAYSGIEMNAAQAAALRTEGYDVVAGLVPPLEVAGAVQSVWMSHTLEHAKDWLHASEMVSAVHAKLDPGGYLVVIAPDIFSWKGDFWDIDWSHGFPTSRNRVEQLMRDCGFEVADSFHHTATFRNPVLVWTITTFFRFFPFKLFDAILRPLTGHQFGSAFMSHFGFRQIFVIGKKSR